MITSSLPEIIALLAAAAVIGYWLEALRGLELARAAGRRACQETGVQLLDDTVQLVRVRVRRNDRGRFAFQREYRFEFTADGVRRERGRLTMLGRRVLHLSLGQ